MTVKPGINKKKTVGCFTNYFSIHTQVHKDKNAPSDRIRTHFAKKRVFAVKDGRVDNYRNEFCLACNVSEVSSRVGAVSSPWSLSIWPQFTWRVARPDVARCVSGSSRCGDPNALASLDLSNWISGDLNGFRRVWVHYFVAFVRLLGYCLVL